MSTTIGRLIGKAAAERLRAQVISQPLAEQRAIIERVAAGTLPRAS